VLLARASTFLSGARSVDLLTPNSRQVRDFARATGRLAKTDRLDAQIIARFAEAVRPEPRAVPDAQPRALITARNRPSHAQLPRSSTPENTVLRGLHLSCAVTPTSPALPGSKSFIRSP
jgi:hypothetical protein